MGDICVLSNLEIPKGKQNIEHYAPKSRTQKHIWNNPANWFPAHKVVNSIKGNLFGCEFEEQKFDLTLYAMYNWKVKKEDKDFLKRTLEHWEEWHRNPCDICLLKCNGRQR